ncbi:dipeptidase [Shewanella psychrotolerans]|uniref:dipeptidase n=1 Tax=Shewanella psychrotolerans TaxID=2864206 RepID=UPI001C660195|nr:dipeptidase [Shewanella psychrotolerans]QYK00018.1 dipeptidase [Shewanella psychrotolerans]
MRTLKPLFLQRILISFALFCLVLLIPFCVSYADDGFQASDKYKLNSISATSDMLANYAVSQYGEQTVESLAKLIRFNTVAVDGLTPDTNPEFIKFKLQLKRLSEQLGLDYADHGYVVLIGLGESERKLGIITHGDVQPADPKLWHKSPYELDITTTPGLLIGRGTEDDKGPIVTAMYAMKAIKDKGLSLDRRIELMVYMAEESDWGPLKAFLKGFTPADINITIDAEYPVVTAEKGWSEIRFLIPNSETGIEATGPSLLTFSGGSFASQVPQQATATLINIDANLLEKIKQRSELQRGMRYQFISDGDKLTIMADGKSVHSSTPEDGVNAVTHLAAILAGFSWPKNQASLTQSFISQMIGLGVYAELFGDIAYSDDFMGKMTLAPTVVNSTEKGAEVVMNLRRPLGKSAELLERQTQEALKEWQQAHGVTLQQVETYWGEPKLMDKAPHLTTLLSVFGYFARVKAPKPIAIGGSTNSKLFPNALSFGPAMPGVEYTGHSEHEFITHEQFMLNLKMYTAAFVELAVKQ